MRRSVRSREVCQLQVRSRRARLGLLALGLAGGLLGAAPGCSKGPTGPGLKFQVAGLAGDQTCRRNMAGVPFAALLREGTLRLSVLRRDPDGTHLQCDLTATVPSEKPSIDLGPVDRARIDIFAELFDPSGMRVLSGAALGTTIPLADGVPQTLPLFPVGSWSCPETVMSAARAFHSATMLPNGEVLLLGGLDAVQNYGLDAFGVLGSAEIYDPRKSAFVALTIGGSLTARAFHQAAVVAATDTQIRLVVYGGVTAAPGRPVLLVPNSASPIRLAAAGYAAPAAAEQLVYDIAARTLTSSPLSISPHMTAFAGGAELYGGGLLTVGGATFTPTGVFNRNMPTALDANTEVVSAFTPRSATAPSFVFSPAMAQSPWLLGPSVTPLSATTALVLGAKVPSQATDPMLALQLSGLPQALNFVNQGGTPLADGAATAYHTATRLGPPLTAANVTADEQILVTGGFLQNPQPGQPPSAATAVRLYTVHSPMGAISPIDYKAVATYNPAGICNTSADGHYRPAGFEAATATPSGQKVLVTGGTPTVTTSGATPCIDCEPGDQATSKLLCALSQVSLYDAATQTFSAGPKMSLGRLGHRQTALLDGTLLVTGGLTRPGGELTVATSEAEVYNPRAATTTAIDPEDPVVAVLDAGQKAMRQGTGLASPCTVLN